MKKTIEQGSAKWERGHIMHVLTDWNSQAE